MRYLSSTMARMVSSRDGENLADFVRGAEAVEEMDERNAGLEGSDLRDQGEIVDFLHGVRGQHGPAGGAACHDVGVVAEDGERVGGQGAGRHVHGGRGELTGDFEHVGDHQQQALRGGEGGSKCTRLQCAVERAGGAALALQFFNDGQCAPDISLPLGAPLIGPLGHGGRGGDGVDGDHFGETIGNRSGSLVPIENYQFSVHSFALPHSAAQGNQPLGRVSFAGVWSGSDA